MKIHGMCVIKDEEDIIAQTLERAAEWCDYIYVLDNGSSDNTWEVVNDLAKVSNRIIPFKKDDQVFMEGIRREIFINYRRAANPGDWWCRLDSDEIYLDDPREFLPRVPEEFEVVWVAMLNYFFTNKDLAKYEQNPTLFSNTLSLEERYRYYKNSWSEPRMFRESPHLFWPSWRAWPILGASFPERIRIKHFQYRSPELIQKRLEVRRKTAVKGGFSWPHEILADATTMLTNPSALLDPKVHARARNNAKNDVQTNGEEWRERIVDASILDFDAHDGSYIIREDLMPPVYISTPSRILIKRWIGRTLNALFE